MLYKYLFIVIDDSVDEVHHRFGDGEHIRHAVETVVLGEEIIGYGGPRTIVLHT